MVRPALAFATSSRVGAKSMFETWPWTVWPVGDAGAAEDERDPQRLLVRQELVAR